MIVRAGSVTDVGSVRASNQDSLVAEDGLFAVLEVNEPRFGARRSARIALKGVRHRPRGDLSELIADQRTDPEPDYHRSGDRQSCGLGQPRREPAPQCHDRLLGRLVLRRHRPRRARLDGLDDAPTQLW